MQQIFGEADWTFQHKSDTNEWLASMPPTITLPDLKAEIKNLKLELFAVIR